MRRIFFLFVVLFFLVFQSSGISTTVIRLELHETVAFSEQIVEGQVIQTQSFLDEKGMIRTRVSLRVSQYLHGQGESFLDFVIPGGQVGNRALVVPGLPKFQVGEESVLFLAGASRNGMKLPVGYAQGKYRIHYEAQTGRKLVQQESMSGLHLVAPQTGLPVEAPANASQDYVEFTNRVRQLARGGK